MIEPTPETQSYWDALAGGRLVARRCDDCGRIQQTPRAVCRCGSEAGHWIELDGAAELVSFTTLSHSSLDYLPAPYTLGVVAFPALGHQLMALIDHPGATPRIGQTLVFSIYRQGDVALPQFTLAPEISKDAS